MRYFPTKTSTSKIAYYAIYRGWKFQNGCRSYFHIGICTLIYTHLTQFIPIKPNIANKNAHNKSAKLQQKQILDKTVYV